MTNARDHQLPRVAAGLPADWRERLEAAWAVLRGADLTSRHAVAEAWLVVVELEVGVAALEHHAAPAAEAALRSLAAVVGDDDDAELRTRLASALLAIGRSRRLAAPPGRAKVDAEVTALEAALVVAERPPVLEGVVATCLAALVKSGQFQTDAVVRERAFEAGQALRHRFGSTRVPEVAAVVARGLDEWAKMLPRESETRAELIAERDQLRRLVGVP